MTTCGRASRTRLRQYDHPDWEPLLAAVGDELASGFMWMHEEAFADGTAIHAYKHRHTRRYLYLGTDGRAFEAAPCGAEVPLRLDFAVEEALCTWGLLNGSDDDVRGLVVRALGRIQASIDLRSW